MAWFNTSYLNKKKLTLDHTKVSGSSDLSSFPVLVSATDVNLKVTGSGGQVQNSSGFDIIFVDSTETTQLDHEIEKYVSTTGEIEMWVRIPTLSHTADTVIYMYFNNSGISTSQENKTGVWDSNYNAVWHLKETSGNQNDSTSNANNITGFTGVTRGSATGKANGADGFTAGQVSEATAPNASTLLPTGDMTLEMWVNISTLATSAIGRFILKDADNYAYQVYQNISSARFSFDWANTSFTVYTVSSNTSPSTATWYYLSCVHDSTNNKIHIYVNGANDDSSTVTTTGTLYVTNPASFALGSSVSGKSPAATIDEVRLSKTIRTDGWLATTYNAVNSPSTFYSTGAMESQRVIPSTAALLQTSTRTITSTAALLQTNTRTITSTAALLQTSTRTITSTASLDSGATTSTRTITSTAALLQTSTRTITSTAALLQTNTRTITSTAALLQVGTRTITSTVALLQTTARPITSTAALLQTNKRTVSSTAALLQTNKRTIPSSVSLGSSRVIPSTAALLQTLSRVIFSSASLASGTVAPVVYAKLLYLQTAQLITASGNSGPLTVGYLGEISLDINITSNQGTSPTIQFFIDRLGTDGVYYPIYDSTSISTAPMVKSASTGAGLGSAASFAGTIQVRWVIGGSSSPGWIYSLSLVGK